MKILLAFDGSRGSEEAAREVCARPWPAGSVVRVFSAFQPVVAPPVAGGWGGGVSPGLMPGVAPAYAEATERLRRRSERVVDQAAEKIAAAKLPVDTAMAQGSAGRAIVAEAESWKADLVVVGSRGLTGVKRWLIGSVAQYVVSHAPCSVEVVRAPPAGE